MKAATSSTDETILAFDPFEGDFVTPGDTVFTNRMVHARKPGPCSHCGLTITKGERIRRQSSKFDGELMTHRWCSACCTTMVAASADDEECDDCWQAYEDRAQLASKTAVGAQAKTEACQP